MNGVGFFMAIIIGLLAGWIAERAMNRRHGLLTNLVVGLIGSVLGGFIADRLGLIWHGFLASLLVSALGAILLLFLLSLFRR